MEWDKDGTERNIFKITLKNKNGSFSFKFGQSVANSCKKEPVIYSGEPIEIFCGIGWKNSDRPNISYKLKTSYNELLAVHNNEKNIKEIYSLNEVSQIYADWLKIMIKRKEERLPKYLLPFEEFIKSIEKKINEAIENGLKQTEYTGQAKNIIHPTAYDVLASITKYDPDTFESFCSEFGYDEDSRTAERTYKAVVKEWNAVERLFSDCLEELQEIQ